MEKAQSAYSALFTSLKKKNNDKRVSLRRTLLRFYAPLLFFIFLLAVLSIAPRSNSSEKRRKRLKDTTGKMEIEKRKEKRERYNTQARILFRRPSFSVLFALSAVFFLDREIVVRRFIYARSAKFTGYGLC